jgi:ADP-ribosylglycohydrolase
MTYIQKIERDGVRDRIFGLILGAFVGDSAGASLDVESYLPNELQIVHALKLAGGGRSSIGPGQVGASSEMAINIVNAIVETNKYTDAHSENVLDMDKVVQNYNQWLQEDPFDYDSGVKFALNNATTHTKAKENSLKMNKNSLTNAALARVMPLAAWTSTLETGAEVKQAVVSDVELSHAHPVV